MAIGAPDWYSVDFFQKQYGVDLVSATGGGTLAADNFQQTIVSPTGVGDIVYFLFTSNLKSMYPGLTVEGAILHQAYTSLPGIGSGGGYGDLSFENLRLFNSDTGLWKIILYDDVNDKYAMLLQQVIPFYLSFDLSANATPADAGKKYDYKLIYRTYL